MVVSAETLTLAALLIAPGVIAVLIGTTLGVVEQEIDRDRLYLTSFVSSIFIDVVFVWLIQQSGDAVTGRAAIERIFFGVHRFRVEMAVLLFALSCLLGLLYAVVLSFNFSQFCRDLLTKPASHRRNPWQPWVGGLRNAKTVQVTLSNGTEVVGMIQEYSRAEKERQIVLSNPQYDFEEQSNRKKIILTGDEINNLQVQTLQERQGLLKTCQNGVQVLVQQLGNISQLVRDQLNNLPWPR